MSFLDSIIGTDSDRVQKKYKKILPLIHNFKEEYKNLKIEKMQKKKH